MTTSWRFQMRELDVTFESSSSSLHAALAHLVNHADDDIPAERSVRFHLAEARDGIVVTDDREAPRTVPDVNTALVAIHRRLSTLLFAVHERFTALHSGAVTIDGRLVLLTGNRGAGKTTTLIRLAMDGAVFHCDEHVMAGEDGSVRTLPRRLHVKPGALDCLPGIAAACRAHPLLHLEGGVAFYPLDLSDIGLIWRSATRPPDAIVHLTPAFDEAPAIEPITQIEMVKRLLSQATGSDLDFGRQTADVCGVVRGARCYALRVGALEQTATLVRNTVNHMAPPRLVFDGQP